MKLRIKGNSLRVRVTRSELEKLISVGRIEDAIYFAPDEYSRLTYAIEHRPASMCTTIRYERQEVAVLIPTNELVDWRESDQVGIYTTICRENYGILEVRVEKDYACLDLSDADDVDTFPNPNAGILC